MNHGKIKAAVRFIGEENLECRSPLKLNDLVDNKSVREKLVELHPIEGLLDEDFILDSPMTNMENIDEITREVMFLLCRFGGIEVNDPNGSPELDYERSLQMCRPLLDGLTGDQLKIAQDEVALSIRIAKDSLFKTSLDHLCKDNPELRLKTKSDNDKNLAKFKNVPSQINLTLYEQKCEFGLTEVKLLGYLVTQGNLKPDPERLYVLLKIPASNDMRSLKRIIGIFAYYSYWIPNYSEKINLLSGITSFFSQS
ncbi:hypothetical protein GJ496_001001 [Pomphorhynchus laevis]|nr:hypothetical protein GJ496_001001 [Pomphorhynchus laevis]